MNPFTTKYAEHQATSVQRLPPARGAAETEQRANALAVFETYRDANAIHRAAIRREYGSLIELGRRVAEETQSPPEPPKDAA